MIRRIGLSGLITMLFVLSIFLLAWQHFGMNKSLRIDANSALPFKIADDRLDGGGSIASLIKSKDAIQLKCQMSDKYEWPYCEVGIQLRKPPLGIDLRSFDTIRMKMSYKGPGRHRVRLFLRNFNPAYSTPQESTSWKLNEIQFIVEDGVEMQLPLSKFNVASWWLADKNIPLEHFGVDLSNVPLMIISTGGNKEAGTHTIDIDYVVFEGKVIQREDLLITILLLWGLLALGVLAKVLYQLHTRLDQIRTEASQLVAANASLKEEKQRITDQAKIDPLTQVRNRAGIRNDIAREMANASEFSPLAMIICDIDHFKAVNDTYGHGVGDEVLVKFAKTLSSNVRHGDYVVRWGGEEFVLFLPNTKLQQAYQTAENLRQTIEESRWPAKIELTASFGVAIIGEAGFAKALEAADAALYEAKNAGRNRVELAKD
ncbi:GGDEF domain-containing protein [Chitinibacter sp. SCUT-21]|uniref:GGDEF domain-containing protein n=1 Tax=Chitinibacter sp. SCUT-21 TaxID=2970891 RepID=UPI0035A621B2